MKIFYRDEQYAENAGSYSPSAKKPKLVVEHWLAGGHISADDIQSFEPATVDDFCLAHDRRYVEGVLSCKEMNGFDNRDASVARSLPYTTGSMLAAAKYAIEHNAITCSPTSGFHHAGYDFGGGFCTFNGLMVTAYAVIKAGLAKRVLIIDMDQHYGNGTQDIIDRDGGNSVYHVTAGMSYKNADEAVEMCMLANWVEMGEFDLVLYQAGADSHVDDPLGGIFTTKQMRNRDHHLFASARKLNLPVAWNLAGGYKRDSNGGISSVLDLHTTTLNIAKGFV